MSGANIGELSGDLERVWYRMRGHSANPGLGRVPKPRDGAHGAATNDAQDALREIRVVGLERSGDAAVWCWIH